MDQVGYTRVRARTTWGPTRGVRQRFTWGARRGGGFTTPAGEEAHQGGSTLVVGHLPRVGGDPRVTWLGHLGQILLR